MVSNRFLFGLLCLAALGGIALPDRNPVGHGLVEERGIRIVPQKRAEKVPAVPGNQSMLIVQAAQKEIGVRETSENSGPRVDEYNAYAGVNKAPWCASFASWCFGQVGRAQPRTAWSPALFPRERCVAEPALGNILGIYYPSKGRIAHCGIVIRADGDWVFSVEGNTNTTGGNEGNGVYAKKRHRRTIAKYADWMNTKKL